MMDNAPAGIKVGFLALFSLATTTSASTYFVATNGSDGFDGSLLTPWATLKYALSRVGDGDTVYMREGLYFESGLTIANRTGLLISAYPGERVEITGGIARYRDAPNPGWELYDAATHLYRSTDLVQPSSYLSAWLLDDSLQLVRYDNMANLQSTNYGPLHGFDPIYQGPGISYGPDGHLYLRLQNNPNDLIDPRGNPIAPVPADIDPNHHRIAVSFTGTLFTVTAASFVKFSNLTISHARYLFDFLPFCSNFEFEGCRFNFGNYGFVLRGVSTTPAARRFEIRDCDFDNGLPQYVYWCDVKNKDQEVGEAYPEFQSEAISGPAPGFWIHNNRFHDSFDAMDLKGGTDSVRIMYNEFYRLRDDAITLKIVKNTEIAYNLMWCVGEGVSCDFDVTDQVTNGDVYVHHNIIDASHYQHGGREGNYRASSWPVWQIIDAFGSHGSAFPAAWKVYNNTTIHRRSGYSWNPAELPAKVQSSADLYVLNNIFLILDDRIAFRGRLASSGAHFDGNVMYRLLDTTYHQPDVGRYPLFYEFGNGMNFSSLADFRANSGTSWEVNGLEIDPQLDVDAIVAGGFEGNETWKRYIPGNSAVFTPGAPYDGLYWPGTDGIDYRGALRGSVDGIADRNQGTDRGPSSLLLDQNFPNPFNPVTTIRFGIPVTGSYSLRVFNLLGQQVAQVFEKELAPGTHAARFDAGTLSSGMYVYVLRGASRCIAKTMLLLK